jgi:hypothetical protein
MTSAINPNNIDGSYPVAGQDNNSQGFRDNFTNIKVNFQSAAEEITDLQSKVVLKSALTGSALDNNLNNNTIYAVNLNDVSTTRVAVTTTSGAVSINYATGQYQTINTTGSITLGFINFPAAGFYGSVRLAVTINNVGYTMSLPAAVTQGITGIQGYSAGTITFGATGTYVFDFSSSDGGTTICITDVSRPLNVYTSPLFLNSSEDLAASGAASLSTTTSYFTTAAAETATLAAGAAGQIKIFSAVDVSAGNMVITVTNAGWKASGTGTATFNARGQSCTLQYTNSKWYAIGNNGVTFA